MSILPACPQCNSTYTYQDRDQFVCPECAYEWRESQKPEDEYQVKDSNGNVLQNGDTVSVVKDLKVRGAASMLKVGTKVKNIRVLDADHIVDGHDIDCKIEGFGAIKLKGSVVKKV
jgi:protein PhnA